MLNDIDAIKDKLKGDIYARFIVFFFALVIVFTQKYLGLTINLKFTYVVTAGICLTNAYIYWAVRKAKINYLTEYYVSLIDFILLNYTIWATRGIDSRLWFLFVIVILIEGISLNRSHLQFNLILALTTYPTIVYFYNQGIFLAAEKNILFSRLAYMALVGSICFVYVNKVLKQQQLTEKLNSDNIVLNSKLEEFSQVLSDEVNKATDDLKEKIREIDRLFKKFRNLFLDFARALSAAIDARDPYTHGHSERVTKIAFTVLEEVQQFYGDMEISEDVKETLLISSLLHDIGKISLPDQILQKPGPLNNEEWTEMKKHPVIGQNILKPIDDLRAAGNIIRSHHERYDGKGYPDNLVGDDIPFLSRVICVADSFDAMTSDRPYRPRMKIEQALAEVKKCEGSQFDPGVVKAFLAAFKKGNLYVTD